MFPFLFPPSLSVSGPGPAPTPGPKSETRILPRSPYKPAKSPAKLTTELTKNFPHIYE